MHNVHRSGPTFCTSLNQPELIRAVLFDHALKMTHDNLEHVAEKPVVTISNEI